MAWMILWWCGGDWEDLGKWTSRELSTSGDCTVLSIQKQAGTLYIIEIMCLGQVRPKFQLCYFVLVY